MPRRKTACVATRLAPSGATLVQTQRQKKRVGGARQMGCPQAKDGEQISWERWRTSLAVAGRRNLRPPGPTFADTLCAASASATRPRQRLPCRRMGGSVRQPPASPAGIASGVAVSFTTLRISWKFRRKLPRELKIGSAGRSNENGMVVDWGWAAKRSFSRRSRFSLNLVAPAQDLSKALSASAAARARLYPSACKLDAAILFSRCP
mmetsp:Transcript_12823/g.28818  ORF Transcript_12823/g.28818 Transcript_12823/m.28818 type:complete len:207 (-) Transcript_12823:490-1110(-)